MYGWVRSDTVWFGRVRLGTVGYGLIRFVSARYGWVRARYATVRYTLKYCSRMLKFTYPVPDHTEPDRTEPDQTVPNRTKPYWTVLKANLRLTPNNAPRLHVVVRHGSLQKNDNDLILFYFSFRHSFPWKFVIRFLRYFDKKSRCRFFATTTNFFLSFFQKKRTY